jgi:anti-sigma B factor antagonist
MKSPVTAVRREDDVLVVTLEGRLDAAAAMSLREDLRRRIRAGSIALVLDLAGVDFVDSTGLSALITALKESSTAGGDTILAAPTATVRSILALTRLDQVFTVYEDIDRAVERLRSVPQR